MEKIESFFQLRTWQEAHALVLEVYHLTARFPSEEKFGLTSQIRRAAVSVPSNIAEGMGRHSTKDLIRFLITARGSIQEVLYQLYLAKDLAYIEVREYEKLSMRYNGLAIGINSHIGRLSYRNAPN